MNFPFFLQILRDIRQGLLQLSRDGRTGKFLHRIFISSFTSLRFGEGNSKRETKKTVFYCLQENIREINVK